MVRVMPEAFEPFRRATPRRTARWRTPLSSGGAFAPAPALGAGLAVCLALGVGCSGTSEGPAEPIGISGYSERTEQAWADFCDFRNDRAAECGWPTQPCASPICLATRFDEVALLDYVRCESTRTCDINFTDCYFIAGTQSDGTLPPARQQFADRCGARFEECDVTATPSDPSADLLLHPCSLSFPIWRDEWVVRVEACLEGACADLVSCTQAIDGDIHPLCTGGPTVLEVSFVGSL